ncbi:cell division protein ZapA [Ancylomarina longa]|uniref:Cell division protein ZapA n=1 Tax=Ancylomarina longa TaxID=2487017 RepID=A0A434AZQ0_9BACT|nr:cell division protein ZapA [Ancylomarina longa]RUT80026.1 cell division protein ZapA [Ancylomarina longa]
MDNKLSIKVNVADRYYPLNIDRDQEEVIRKAAKMINEKVLQYKQRYKDKDTQDFLAMASLQFVIKVIESESKADVSPIIEELATIEKELNEFLEKEN